jgi:hypothetical protein
MSSQHHNIKSIVSYYNPPLYEALIPTIKPFVGNKMKNRVLVFIQEWYHCCIGLRFSFSPHDSQRKVSLKELSKLSELKGEVV